MGVSLNNQNVSSLDVAHTSTLAAGEIAAKVVNTVTAALNVNESNSAIAALSILTPTSACGNPSYFVNVGGEIQVPAVSTNHLANSLLYAGKFIVNFNTSATSGNCVGYLVGLESELILKSSNASGTVTYPNVYNLYVANEPFTQTGGGNMSIGEYRGIYVEALSLGARVSITNQWNVYIEDTAGGSYFGAPIMVIGAAAPAVGGITHRGTGGIRTESASTQDGMKVVGRAGGSSSFTQTITTSALTASRTATLPDANLTIASITTKAAVTQITSRTTPVTCNGIAGDITLVSAAGSGTWNNMTVNNSSVVAGDIPVVIQRSGTDAYIMNVTNVANGSFKITYADVTGSTVEQPVFSFFVHKFSAS